MDAQAYAIGQAVYLRTDTPDFAEEMVPFSSLQEMVKICSAPRENRVLEKVIVFAMADDGPCALTLGFISATRGQRPGNIYENASD